MHKNYLAAGIKNDAGNAPGQLRCFKRHLKLLIKKNSVQYITMNDSRFLALPLDAQKLTYESNLQLLSKEKLTLVDEIGWDWFCMENRTSSAQQVKFVGIQV